MRLFKIMETAYESFDSTVKNYLSKAFNSIGVDASHTHVFNLLYDGIKGIIQNAMFYIEDALTEQNIFTAKRKKSIYSLAKLTGYEPYYGTAASGTLKASVIRGQLLDSDATKIFVPNGSIIIDNETNIKYILRLSSNEYVIDITKPLVTHEFKIVEGLNRAAAFNAKGKTLETFQVSTNYALFEKSYISVYVNGVKYHEAASLYDMGENEDAYIISVGYDGGFEIMFGDGIYGRRLEEGDAINVEYIAHNGSLGNVMTSSLTNFKFISSGRDTFGNSVDLNKFIKLTMSNCISGGTDSDSIETIRSMVGFNSRSLILATEENFTQFFKRFSFIGRANCWSHESTMKVIAVCTSNKINDVKNIQEYFGLELSELYLSTDQKEQIINAMANSNRTFAGISLHFYDPSFARYAAVCIVKAKDSYNHESIKEELREVLGNYFINLPEGVQIIYKSDVITTVMNTVSSIESFDIQFLPEKAEISFKQGYYQKVTIEYQNGMLLPKYTNVFYSPINVPGLDEYGNILLDSKIEIPLLHGGFNYYDKENVDKNSSIKIDTLQYVFI